MEGKTTTKLVNSSTIAQLFGVSTQWVQTLTRNGIIRAVSDKGGYKYDLLQTIKLYIAHLQAKVSEKENVKDKETQLRAQEADASLKEAKAGMAALEFKDLESIMIPSELVEASTTDMLLAIEQLLTDLPEKLKRIHELETAAEVSLVIQNEAHAVLRTLAEYQYDPEAYEKRKAAYEARTRETGSILTAKRGGKTS
jgi:phage terminase Nu1 subunit (DNA packaging protein)